MIERKQQQEALELITVLEQLAVETGMKLRIVNALRERAQELQSPIGDSEWEKELLKIEEVITYMEKQLWGEEEIAMKNGDVISRNEVKNRIQEIWALCRDANQNLLDHYRRVQAVSRQELESNMMDWTNVSANYEMMVNPSRFDARCQETGQMYKRHMDGLISEYVDESAREYNQAINKIKGLISDLDQRQITVTVRDIYEKWDSRQEQICQSLKRRTEQIEKGETALTEFGQAHTGVLQHIVRRKKRKRIFYIWMPLLVIVAFFLLHEGLSYVKMNQSSQDVTAVHEEGSFVETIAADVKDKAADKISGSIVGNLAKIAVNLFLPLVILLVAAWIFWNYYTQKLCRKWMIQDLEKYMRQQVENFWRENSIAIREEECFWQVEDIVVQCYDSLFKKVLGKEFGIQEKDSPEIRMAQMRKRWNEMKYM